MLQGVFLPLKLHEDFSGTNDFGIIPNFSQLNTFIGTNNSGKSRFLRTLFSEKDVKFINETSANKIAEICEFINNNLKSLEGFDIHYSKKDEFALIRKSIIGKKKYDLSTVLSLYELMNSFEKGHFKIQQNRLDFRVVNFLNNANSRALHLRNTIESLGNVNPKLKKIYIPILRGLRPIAEYNNVFSNENIYLKRTKHDYFKTPVSNGEIFTGLSIYEDIKKLLLGNEGERNEIKLFEEFLTQNLFKKKVNLIPKYDDDVLHIKIEGEEQFPIYKLGDGLQTLIVILYPIFINRNNPSLIFIEEPETHLHPRWQRLLNRALVVFDSHTYFISTHSSVFINSPNNSIFIVSKILGKTNLYYSNIKTDKISILKELGYRPNDLYQTNYIIWVEGPSDKIYINYFIKEIDKNLIEGEDYSIMFYGGSSYRHFLENDGVLNLEFIESLNQNYAIIMDSDRTKPKQRYDLKKKKIVDLFEKNKAFCWLTKLREIENYIPFNDFKDAVKSVHKINNIEMDDSDYADRCKYVNLDVKSSYKATIKLSNTFFSKIQKNKDGSLKGINTNEIKEELERAINETKKEWNNINKIKVADQLLKNGISMENDELLKKMNELVKDIKKANN